MQCDGLGTSFDLGNATTRVLVCRMLRKAVLLLFTYMQTWKVNDVVLVKICEHNNKIRKIRIIDLQSQLPSEVDTGRTK